MINDYEIAKTYELFDDGLYNEALESFEKIVSELPNCEKHYFYLGMCYEKLDYEEKAVFYYKKGLELCDDVEYISDYHLNIGKNLIYLSRLNEALYHFEKAEAFEPNREFAVYNKAVVYICQKKYSKALMMLQTIKKLDKQKIEKLVNYCKYKLAI